MFYLHLSIPESLEGIVERAFPLSWKRIKRVHAFFLEMIITVRNVCGEDSRPWLLTCKGAGR